MIKQIFTAILLGQGLAFGMLAYFLYWKKSAKLTPCERTSGEVIEIKEKRGGDGPPTKHPVVRYKNVKGEDVTFASDYGSSNWQIKVGDRVEILAHPTNPQESEVVNLAAQWLLPLICAGTAVGSLIGALAAYLFLK